MDSKHVGERTAGEGALDAALAAGAPAGIPGGGAGGRRRHRNLRVWARFWPVLIAVSWQPRSSSSTTQLRDMAAERDRGTALSNSYEGELKVERARKSS